MSYEKEFNSAKHTPEAFWKKQSQSLPWFKEANKVLSQDELRC